MRLIQISIHHKKKDKNSFIFGIFVIIKGEDQKIFYGIFFNPFQDLRNFG